MSKNFLLILGCCIVFLGVFIYFIFGFNQTSQKMVPSTQPTQTQAQAQELQSEDIQVGTGPEVKSGDTISIDYKGTLPDGTVFDSSYERGQPFETQIGVGQVIKGWDEGVIGMQVGGKRKLVIPPAMGYGEQDMGTIPPNSTLIFEVELREIK